MIKITKLTVLITLLFSLLCPGVFSQTTVVGQDVVLIAKDGAKIHGTFYDSGKGTPVAILLHMMRRDRKDWENFVLDLEEQGFSALSIDLRGHGQSREKTDGGALVLEAFRNPDFKAMEKDVAAAMEFLGKSGVDKNRIAIVGASIGANTAINYAANHPGVIKAVVMLSPGLNYRNVKCTEALTKYPGPVFLTATKGDKYSAQSVLDLSGINRTRITSTILSGKTHGTNMFLRHKDLPAKIAGWLGEKVKK